MSKLLVLAVLILIASLMLYNAVEKFRGSAEYKLTSDDRIIANGYSSETYTVHTEDGYMLKLIRISNSTKYSYSKEESATKPVVYLQHGLFCSSDTWIIGPPNYTLAYLLVDAGYDVWIGNSRGNQYSKSHVSFFADSTDFWQFNLHESGYYDLPALLEYVLKQTQQTSLHIITDSQGTTNYFILMSERPEYNKIVRTSHHLSPMVFFRKSRSAVKLLTNLGVQRVESFIGDLLQNRECFTHDSLWNFLCSSLCAREATLYPICEFILSIIVGSWLKDQQILSSLCATHPAGASSNQILHYAQWHESHRFQRFDYGSSLNLEYYNNTHPPEYDLSKITSCVVLYHGDQDYLAEIEDVQYLVAKLKCAKAYQIPQDNWSHIDFMLHKDAKQHIYDNIIAQMISYDSN